MSNFYYSLGKPYSLEEKHFARLLYHYQHDLEKIVTYQPTGRYGFESTDVQIFSSEWYGTPKEGLVEQIEQDHRSAEGNHSVQSA